MTISCGSQIFWIYFFLDESPLPEKKDVIGIVILALFNQSETSHQNFLKIELGLEGSCVSQPGNAPVRKVNEMAGDCVGGDILKY